MEHYKELLDRLLAYVTRATKAEDEVERLKAELSSLNAELNGCQLDIEAYQDQITELKAELDKKSEVISYQYKERMKLEAEIKELEKDDT